MNIPFQCKLWQKEPLTSEDLILKGNFDQLKTYSEENHDWRYLLKCKECGQLYLYEFHEEVDWADSEDSIYCTFVPVETAEESDEIALLNYMDLGLKIPQLHNDKTKDHGNRIYWIRKLES